MVPPMMAQLEQDFTAYTKGDHAAARLNDELSVGLRKVYAGSKNEF
jgi:hypothetical protein